MINRQVESEIELLKNEFPILAILGPRQSGKTTLAKKMFPEYEYVSLEDYDVNEYAENDPRGFLNRYSENVIFDEIQRNPRIISYLQTHVDALGKNGKIVVTGSQNFLLMEKISQSLAGRVGITKLLPFSVEEIKHLEKKKDEIIFSGLYPRIYDQDIRPGTFYKNYITTYIEKDVRLLKNITKLDVFVTFMKILAGRTGQELNYKSIGEECGVSHATIMEWISVLEASFIIYRLRPYYKNYNKRLVKSPKLYFIDTGLVCSLLGIRKREELDYHFLKGSIFETFVVTEILKAGYNTGGNFEIYFWRDNHKKEIDIIIDFGNKMYGLEIKSSETISEEYFDGLKYWRELTGTEKEDLYLVYGGRDNLIRNGMNVVSWDNIYDGIIAGR